MSGIGFGLHVDPGATVAKLGDTAKLVIEIDRKYQGEFWRMTHDERSNLFHIARAEVKNLTEKR